MVDVSEASIFDDSEPEPPDDPAELLSLDPWEEICGRFWDLYELEGWLYVKIRFQTYCVPVDSYAADILRETLSDPSLTHVCLLRTDSPEEPIIVRNRFS